MIHRALSLFGGYPPILPGLLVAFLLSLLLSPVVSRRLPVGRLHTWLILIGLGVILAVTLTPSREAIGSGAVGTIGCDLSRIGPASWSVYAKRGDPILNVFMFIPLGVAIGLLPPSGARRWLVVAALLLPLAIEATQGIVIVLDRACQGGDVFDNAVGLCLGLAAGSAARAIWQRAGERTDGLAPDSWATRPAALTGWDDEDRARL